MVEHDILHRAFYSTRRGAFGLFRAVDKSRDANELGAYLVAIENLVADGVLQGEDIVAFHKHLRSGQRNLEAGGFDGSLAHFRRSEIQGGGSGFRIVLASIEHHLCHLHSRLGVHGLNVDGQHVLVRVTGTDGLGRGGCCGDTVEVHWLWGEQADLSFPSCESGGLRCCFKHYGQRAIVGS